jgi:hypothetical protein
MKKSRDSVYIIFDKAGIFERAVADIFKEQQTHAG